MISAFPIKYIYIITHGVYPISLAAPSQSYFLVLPPQNVLTEECPSTQSLDLFSNTNSHSVNKSSLSALNKIYKQMIPKCIPLSQASLLNFSLVYPLVYFISPIGCLVDIINSICPSQNFFLSELLNLSLSYLI